MREACRLASEVLDYIAPHIKPGITTLEIDRLGAECMAQQGTVSATVGYQPPGYPPYPGVAVHLGQPCGVPRHSQRQAA